MENDPRLSAIEGRLTGIENEQRTHFRWSVTFAATTVGLTITVGLGLAGLILSIANSLTSRIDRLDDRLTRVEVNVNELPGKLTNSLNQINQTLFQAITASKPAPQPPIIVLPPNIVQKSSDVEAAPSSAPQPMSPQPPPPRQ